MALRKEKALLLGFASFAELSMASKVCDICLFPLKCKIRAHALSDYPHCAPPCLCPNSQMAELSSAEALLEELRSASQAAGKKDLEEVKEFAKLQGCIDDLLWWVLGFNSLGLPGLSLNP